ncbi:MAG: nucleoside-diphosphate kinase [Candidatus Marsarchaeota archaeon]|nr:nucleoside-diphosphate kinase [Candidatus Marsarchaeota archaeon]MCL5412782.1 nucleoside-diphosphate kinase [Candidatus Marsarchaeota archaeon]
MDGDIVEKITDVALKCTNVDLIDDVKIGQGDWENELLFFIKPEVFLLKDRQQIKNTVSLLLETLSKFNAKIEGTCAVNGTVLDKHRIMSSHYGFINVMSNSASKTADEQSRKRIGEVFNIIPSQFEILGGHEYLNRYKDVNGDELDRLWFAEKSVKIRSGFYVRLIKKDGNNIVLVNGFHPKQLSYFTDPKHTIVLMLLHSNTRWPELKNSMVGATFPEKAAPESMRGILYARAREFGFEEVTIANNCVHLSAGPFEAMSEIVNFFSKLAGVDIRESHPNALKKMLEQGVSYDNGVSALNNPTFEYNGKQTDLFSATEEMDTDKAITVFRERILKA